MRQLSLCVLAAVVAAGAAKPPAPVHLTAQQDHARLMRLLHIGALRPGADPGKAATNPPNYDESKAGGANLPDALRLDNGRRVTTAAEWWHKRRPQIEAAFDRDVYGRVPRHTPRVEWIVTSSKHEEQYGIPVVTKRLRGHADNSSYPPIDVNIALTLTTPAEARGPVPVMMDFGFDPAMFARFLAQLKARGVKLPPPPPGPPWQKLVLERGWGYAVLVATSVQADNGAGLTEGIIGLSNRGQPRRPDQWGALRAWAWGASRALDYFESDRAVNAQEVGIEGVSRYGKAALVAMADDPRFAVALIGSSGAGGAKPFRRNFGEQIGNLAGTGEYQWMAGNFLRYDGPLTAADLPVDANELIALCAPRPVFISTGNPQIEGGWIDDRGMFLAAVAAGPVYRLLGGEGLGTTAMPPLGTALIDGDIGWRQHHGGHTDGPNWPAFLNFAARHFQRGKPSAGG